MEIIDNDEINMCVIASNYDITDEELILCAIKQENIDNEVYKLNLTVEQLDSLYYCIPLNFY